MTALVDTGSPANPDAEAPAIALNYAEGLGPRAHTAHWFTASSTAHTYRNELTISGGDTWSNEEDLDIAAIPAVNEVYDPDITYRFTGAQRSVRAQKRDVDVDSDNDAELVTNRDILVQNDLDTLAPLLFPRVATNGENLADVFAVYALPEDTEDTVTIIFQGISMFGAHIDYRFSALGVTSRLPCPV